MGMDDQQNDNAINAPHRVPTTFTILHPIKIDLVERIVPNPRGGLEGHSMLFEVRPSFLGILLK